MFPGQSATALPPPSIPPAIYDELLSYLRKSGCALTPAEAVHHALKLWIAQQQADALPERGYQWKQLFLPDGTRVRLNFDGQCYLARVEGDELIYQGRPMSPHQMVLLHKQAASVPKSPEEAMSAAAKAMSDALTTALTLVEHANYQSQNYLERRLPRYRRVADLMEDVD